MSSRSGSALPKYHYPFGKLHVDRRIAERIRKKGEYRSRILKSKKEPKTFPNEEIFNFEQDKQPTPTSTPIPTIKPESAIFQPTLPKKTVHYLDWGLIPTSKWKVLEVGSNSIPAEPILSANLLYHPLAEQGKISM